MKMFRKDEGFTLIELMVVVLIIGILVAIAIPVFNAAKANAQQKSCFANQRTVEGAAHTFEASAGLLPADGLVALGAALVPAYLAKLPTCALGNYTWTQSSGKLTCNYVGPPDHTHYN